MAYLAVDQPAAHQLQHNLVDDVVDALHVGLHHDLGVLRLLIWGRDAGKFCDLAAQRLGVESLGVCLLYTSDAADE